MVRAQYSRMVIKDFVLLSRIAECRADAALSRRELILVYYRPPPKWSCWPVHFPSVLSTRSRIRRTRRMTRVLPRIPAIFCAYKKNGSEKQTNWPTSLESADVITLSWKGRRRDAVGNNQSSNLFYWMKSQYSKKSFACISRPTNSNKELEGYFRTRILRKTGRFGQNLREWLRNATSLQTNRILYWCWP